MATLCSFQPPIWLSYVSYIGPVVISLGSLGVAVAVYLLGKQQSATSRENAERDQKIRIQGLRLELLTDRRECIAEFREIQSIWWQHDRLEQSDYHKLHDIFQQSQLVFDQEIIDDLDKALTLVHSISIQSKRVIQYNADGKEVEAKERQKIQFAAEDALQPIMESLLKRMIAASSVTDLVVS